MNANNYQISVVEAAPRHILCEVYVNVSIAIAEAFTEEIDALIEKQSLPYLLIDVRGVRNLATAGQNYEFTQNKINDVKHRRNTVALLIDKHDRSHDFVEMVAVNRGHRIRLFTNPSAVLDWFRHHQEVSAVNETS